MKTIFSSPVFFIVLSFIYPAFYMLQINSHIYTSAQIFVTLIFLIVFSIITALFLNLLLKYIVKLFFVIFKNTDSIVVGEITKKIYGALIGSAGVLILLDMLFSVTQEIIFNNIVLLLFILMVIVFTFALAYRFGLRFFNILLTFLVLFNCLLWVHNSIAEESSSVSTQKLYRAINFKQKPNVYLVILESYASMNIRKEVYDIDNSALVTELHKNGYQIRDVYTNYAFTLPSVASVFMMEHHYYRYSRGLNDGGGYRKIIGGVVPSTLLDTFLDNGYKIDYSNFTSNLYQVSNKIYGQESQPLLQPLEIFSGPFWFSRKILHYNLHKSTIFQALLWLPESVLGIRQVHVVDEKINDNTKPILSLIYSGAYHTPNLFSEYPQEMQDFANVRRMPFWQLNRIDNYWYLRYKDLVEVSDVKLINLIKNINDSDPDAVVILLGDHGAYLNRNIWLGEDDDLNKNILKNGLLVADVTRDLFEVFLAVKWPRGMEDVDKDLTPVNIFYHIFAFLSGDNAVLELQVPNDSFMFADKKLPYFGTRKVFRVASSNRPLDEWEVFIHESKDGDR